jgi:hypothetical protein
VYKQVAESIENEYRPDQIPQGRPGMGPRAHAVPVYTGDDSGSRGADRLFGWVRVASSPSVGAAGSTRFTEGIACAFAWYPRATLLARGIVLAKVITGVDTE